MLVYVRESDKEKVFCDVDEKDIAEHLRVNHIFRYEKKKFSFIVECDDNMLSLISDKVEKRT